VDAVTQLLILFKDVVWHA